MKTLDFTKTITAEQLNENMFKKFGTKINFDKYTREELENYRNILRTQIHQVEATSNFNDLLTKETYQKDKFVISVLNTKIKEMLGEGAKVDRQAKHITASMMKKGKSKEEAEGIAWAHIKHPKKKKKASEGIEGTNMKTNEAKKAKRDYDGDGKVETPKDEVWGSRAKAAAKAGKPFKEDTGKFDKTATTWTDKSGKKHPAQRVTRKTDQLAQGTEDQPVKKKVKEAAKPDFLDLDKDGNKKEPMKGAAKSKKKIKESTLIFRRHVAIVNESLAKLLWEDEEGKAKAITAASDMVNDYTTWMQRVGQYQTKSMIELADSIRSDFGQEASEAFKQTVAPALSATLETLTQQRETISHAVAVLAGEATDMEPMGEPGMNPAADDVGGEEIPPAGADEMNAGGDGFDATDAASSSREMRESREIAKQRRLAEAHSLMRTLSR
jgi:hypothetical protein